MYPPTTANIGLDMTNDERKGVFQKATLPKKIINIKVKMHLRLPNLTYHTSRP